MAEFRIYVDIGVSPGLARAGLAVLLLAGAAAELGSESLTLKTYYPSPEGVYGQLLTTGQTLLACDGGPPACSGGPPYSVVSIGRPSAVANVKLNVDGNVYVGKNSTEGTFYANGFVVPGDIFWGSETTPSRLYRGGSIGLGGTGSGGTPYIDFHYGNGGSTPDYNARIINTASSRLDFATYLGGNVMTVDGNRVGVRRSPTDGALDVTGIILARQSCRQIQIPMYYGQNCAPTNPPPRQENVRGTVSTPLPPPPTQPPYVQAPCGGNEYITTIQGMYANYYGLMDSVHYRCDQTDKGTCDDIGPNAVADSSSITGYRPYGPTDRCITALCCACPDGGCGGVF